MCGCASIARPPARLRGESRINTIVPFLSYAGLVVAALGGAAIGFERQWSGHASGPQARFGGIRTFTMLGGLAGVAGWLGTAGLLPLAVVLLAGAAALIVAAYAAASRVDVDGTTEVAALVTLAAGTLSGAGFLILGSATVAITALLLVEKSRLHSMVARIDDEALRASVRFAVMALVVLPLLPEGPYGPFDAVRPRELWAFVLFFSALSFVGWLARRSVGARHGTIIAGLLGGIVSSTTVTLTFARASRGDRDAQRSLAIGVVGACTMMLVRVAAASALLNPPLSWRLLPYVAPAFVVGALAMMLGFRLVARDPAPPVAATGESPLQLRAALQMTALFQAVLFIVFAVRAWWEATALLMTSALIGLTDLDALTLSLARSTPEDGAAAGAVALTVGILSNTLLKLAVAITVGQAAFRWIVGLVLGAMAAAFATTLLTIG